LFDIKLGILTYIYGLSVPMKQCLVNCFFTNCIKVRKNTSKSSRNWYDDADVENCVVKRTTAVTKQSTACDGNSGSGSKNDNSQQLKDIILTNNTR
jgi:hypothetical protein